MTTKGIKHFVKQVAKKTGYDKDLVRQVIDSLHSEIITALEEPGTVVLLDCFGKFRDTRRISQVMGKDAKPSAGIKGTVLGWKTSHWVRFHPAFLFRAYLNPHDLYAVKMARGDWFKAWVARKRVQR